MLLNRLPDLPDFVKNWKSKSKDTDQSSNAEAGDVHRLAVSNSPVPFHSNCIGLDDYSQLVRYYAAIASSEEKLQLKNIYSNDDLNLFVILLSNYLYINK